VAALGATTAEGIIGGAMAGGAAAGAVRTAFTGGNFLENVFGSVATSGLLASLQVLAMQAWELAERLTDESSLAGKGQHVVGADGRLRTDGARACEGACDTLPGMEKEGGRHWYDPESFYGRFVNLVSKVHDLMNAWNYKDGNFVGRGVVFNSAFDALWSLPGMIPAGLFTGFAFYGNAYSYSVPLR